MEGHEKMDHLSSPYRGSKQAFVVFFLYGVQGAVTCLGSLLTALFRID
jgi:hypothetical protein